MNERDDGRFATILVGTDGSASSVEAVTFAVGLAADRRAQLMVVHVVPPLDVIAAEDDDAYAQPHEVTERDRAPLEAAAALAAAHQVVATTELLAGRTVPEIVSYGDRHRVDLIVVGSSGRGALADAVLGSVSLGVLRKATRPVLIVRGGRTG
jgi:nucleotide-binding universal stress UspA family protein